jgi:TolB-like protein/DNA-binding winged helix-turn-helix (wHTH) protein/tetratricopeptide (TPR) repeat protein
MQGLAPSGIFVFEEFRLDRSGGLSRRDDTGAFVPVAIGSRALDILGVLIERAGEVVSKEEIIAAVWPRTVVEDSNLTVQISALRRVLDNQRSDGSCIQTVAGRGYRFVAAVRHPAVEAGSDIPPMIGEAEDSHDRALPAVAALPTDGGMPEHQRSTLGTTGNGRDRGGDVQLVPPVTTSARARLRAWRQVAALFVGLTVSGSLVAWVWDRHWSGNADTRPRFSMVVLPFSSLGPDPGQEQFVDAITSDLTTALARIGHSFVISRNTAFTYRNKSLDTKQIGRELGVRYVLEGDVRRYGNRVRVDAQLIDAETGALVWAQQFDGDVGDLFAVEDDITRRIVIALGIELVGREAARPTRDPDAFDYILRGAAVMSGAPKTRKTYAEAVSLFDRALTLDPRAVEAQSFLAIHLAGRVTADVTDSAAADIVRAEALAGQAVAASPRSALAHMAQAMVLRAQNRFNEAIRAYDAVLTLNRNFVPAYANIAYAKLSAGSTEDAIPLLEEAVRLSPSNSDVGSWYWAIGRAHLMEARVDQAVFWLEKSLSANPEVGPQPHAWLASAYALEGKSERAATELAEARRLSSDSRYSSISRLKAAYPSPKARALLEPTYFAGLRKAGMPEE